MCRELMSKWYFDIGEGMQEEDSVYVESSIDAIDFVRQSIKAPPGCRHLRWDPCDEPCIVGNALFATDDGRSLTPALVNGIPVGDGFIFTNSDPHYVLSFEEAATHSFVVHVTAEFHYLREEFIVRAICSIDEEMKRRQQLYEEGESGRKKGRRRPAFAPQASAAGGSAQPPPADDSVQNEALRVIRRMMIQPEDNGQFVPYSEHGIEFKDGDVKPIAFYLPQFHSIPENDEWWGKGFTEWDNVAAAVPSYDGHYQPQLPYDVGFYDLSHFDVMKRQIELAKNYGIYGFCFYYYRFGAKRILEKPLENFLGHKEELDMPFCVCWANENWSRRWDGHDKEVLLEQTYSDEDNLLCIEDIAGYFADERYIRIDGKPLVVVYRGNLIPNMPGMLDDWRRYCVEAGVGEIVIAGCAMDGIEDPLAFGFDIGIDFTPNSFMTDMERETRTTGLSPLKREYYLYDMDEYIGRVDEFIEKNEKMFYSVFPAWDNTARRRSGAYVFPLSPERYKHWLKKCIEATAAAKDPAMRFVFINAWNEWAEGAHLEPDRRYGYAYLEATAGALSEAR